MVGAPTDNDVEWIRRTVVNLLHIFRYHWSQDILSGLINVEAHYLARYGHALDRLKMAEAEN